MKKTPLIITAGSTYLDIDAYACCVAMAELLRSKGETALAYSKAPCNYSVCPSLIQPGQIADRLPPDVAGQGKYIIVDVSDPDFLKDSVPLADVVEVYDHHVGFEDYWSERIGDGAHIEFIGAAATLIWRQWKQAGLHEQMSRSTALLLIAAILDNTLNLTSSNTTREDRECLRELCEKENIGPDWCAAYLSEVQAGVEADLKNALFGDIKFIRNNPVLPERMAQLCVWDGERILEKLPQMRCWFEEKSQSWMINVIDIRHRCSYFVCEDPLCQQKIGALFGVRFSQGVAKTEVAYLRKEIIKKTISKY